MNEGTKRTLKRVIDIVIAVLTAECEGRRNSAVRAHPQPFRPQQRISASVVRGY